MVKGRLGGVTVDVKTPSETTYSLGTSKPVYILWEKYPVTKQMTGFTYTQVRCLPFYIIIYNKGITIKNMNDIHQVLEERGTNYGGFDGNAKVSQNLKAVFQTSPNYDKLTDVQREALDLIATKLSRVLSGNNVKYVDTWTDISGYAKLVEQDLCK
jgi:hypothetical protein